MNHSSINKAPNPRDGPVLCEVVTIRFVTTGDNLTAERDPDEILQPVGIDDE